MTNPPPILTELKLTEEIKRTIHEAYEPNDRPLVLGYVDEQGRPGMSYRGSVVVLGDARLGIWARNPAGGTVRALGANPNLTLVYREPGGPGQRSRAVIVFRGEGRVDADGDDRRRIYEAMPQRERDADPEMKGVGIVVDLESVSGFVSGMRLQMQR